MFIFIIIFFFARVWGELEGFPGGASGKESAC